MNIGAMWGRRRWLATVAVGLGARAGAQPSLGAPKGAVVLSVRGRISRTNSSQRADFDMPMLEALAQQHITTKTPWYRQPRKFTGPLLRDVLARVGAQGAMLRLTALNDYRIDVPIDDTRRFDVVLARAIDDQPITVRERGPLFVIYPFDSDPALRNALYYSRSVWQLKTIDVL
jgi:hypothetical protein